MIEKIKGLVQKYREEIRYLLTGAATTCVDFVVSYLLYYLNVNVHVADVFGWIFAVLFAYVVSRIWVFESKSKGFLNVLRELFTFFGGRAVTFLLQEGLVFLFFDCLKWNKYLVRIPVAVLVVVLNYLFSKWLVFYRKK